MELVSLLFISISFSQFRSNFSSLMVYFLIQALASLSIVVFWAFSSPFFLSLFLFLKLSSFPFHSWYLSVCYSFPNVCLLFASTLQKLPPFLLLSTDTQSYSTTMFFFCSIATVWLLGSSMLASSDMRYLLILSSVANNSWLLLAFCTSDLFILFFFFLSYSFSFYLILFLFNAHSSPSFSLSLSKGQKFLLLIVVSNMSAFPPFPMFFVKLVLLFSLFSFLEWFSSGFLMLLLLGNGLLVIGYFQCLMKLYFYEFTAAPLYIVF